ncbi:Uncharacterized protein FWK35_00008210 [Aphis craccivora]|uniref:Uncharacterized protein n=1 Tax=Aphis craccivora TaxID=307492 RepID=A0A6G0ZRW0_APHCR|nr:Uncharacterized protein FWK35_00008210 [Aphis craccivora]
MVVVIVGRLVREVVVNVVPALRVRAAAVVHAVVVVVVQVVVMVQQVGCGRLRLQVMVVMVVMVVPGASDSGAAGTAVHHDSGRPQRVRPLRARVHVVIVVPVVERVRPLQVLEADRLSRRADRWPRGRPPSRHRRTRPPSPAVVAVFPCGDRALW